MKIKDIAYYVTNKVKTKSLTPSTYIGIDNILSNRGGIVPSSYFPDGGEVVEFRKGDVLLGNIRPYFKKIWLATFDGGCSPDVLCFRSNGKVSPEFLYCILSQDGFFEYATKGAKGSKMPRGDKGHILEFPVETIANQNRVGSLINSFNSKIRINNKLSAELETLVKLLYDYWFVQFDFPDENGRPYKSSGGKMVWNADLNREVPDGWNAVRIGDIITAERGISYSTKNIKSGAGVPMINLASFQPGEGSYKHAGIKYYDGDYPLDKVLKPFDLIMCNTQQTAVNFATDIIGRAMLVPDIFNGDVVYSHHVTAIRPTDHNLKFYLLHLFNSDYFHKYISGFTNGTNILGLLFNGVKDYRIESPAIWLLEKFNDISIRIEKQKSELMKENCLLITLRDFLLPLLMNGQVTFK